MYTQRKHSLAPEDPGWMNSTCCTRFQANGCGRSVAGETDECVVFFFCMGMPPGRSIAALEFAGYMHSSLVET